MADAKTETKRGRTHDAAGAREAILNAAEHVFAEHGFDGARIDAIAALAGYNKSLIFQYFGDKLGLYGAVIRMADEHTREVQAQALAALLDDAVISDVGKFKLFLKMAINAYLDYLIAHPRDLRIQLWEMAEGWQTYAKIISQRDLEDTDQFRPFLEKAQNAGVLRPGFDPIIQVTMAVFFCHFYLGALPLFQLLQPGEEFSSSAALARARDHIVEFIVGGLMSESPIHPTP